MTWQPKIPPNEQYIVRAFLENEFGQADAMFWGPFKNEKDAQDFMNNYPDDPDLIEMDAIWMNEVENTTDVEAM